jgi:hypothetical protein
MLKIALVLFCFFSLQLQAEDSMDKLLKVCVKAGEVDYSYLKIKEGIVDSRLKQMAKINLDNESLIVRKAFWINAYNLATIKLILNHYPLKSIKDIPSSERWLWKGWDFGGQQWSLDEIEHKILRPMGDPRIHFAINCASRSCPVLRAEFYQPEKLESELDLATRNFLKDPNRGMLLSQRNSFFGWGADTLKVRVSKLFNWFSEDFTQNTGSIIDFLKTYGDKDTISKLHQLSDLDIRYLDYDWTLNGR